MTQFIGRVFIGIGIFGVSYNLIKLATWEKQHSSHLEDDRVGPLFHRCKETFAAILKKKEIKNENVSKRHVNLVATMSSKNYAKKAQPLVEEELEKIVSTSGYLFNAVEKDVQSKGVVVFKYIKDFSVYFPLLHTPNQSNQRFLFSGETDRLFDLEARESIINGEYVRCRDSIYQRSDEKHYLKKEVIISGTTDFRKCDDFALEFFTDTIHSAAEGKGICDHHPLSDAFVVEFTGKDFQILGDLAKFPERSKKEIKKLNFTACSYVISVETRLSGELHKRLGAAIIGIKDPKACHALHTHCLDEIDLK